MSKVYGIPLTRRTAASLVRDMMLALGAMGAVEVATRLLASGVKSSLAGLTILSGGLAVPLTALGYGAIGLAQGGDGRDDLLRPRPRGQDLPPAGLPVGPAGIKTVIQQILAEAKADSVIDRLRDDLKKRLKK